MSTSLNRQVNNRLLAVMAHLSRYSFQGQARLAKDAGVSRSAVCRLINGRSSPSFALVLALTRALEQQLGKRVDPRELLSMDGSYPTPSVCELVGCKGCLPDAVYDEKDCIKPQYRHVKPGQWSTVPELAAQPGGVEDEEEL